MKKLIILIVCLFVLGVINVTAENLESVVVDVSTAPADGDTYVFAASDFTMIIATNVPMSLISRITLTSDDTTVAQTVTLWDGWTNGTSSAAVSKIWEWDLDATGADEAKMHVVQEYFLQGDRGFLKADYGLYATKTDSSGNITLSIQYK